MGNFLSGQMEADSLLLPFDPVPSLEEADSISFDFGMVPLPAIESLDSLEETPESVESQEPHNSKKRVKEERERTPDKPPASLKVCIVFFSFFFLLLLTRLLWQKPM